MLTKPLVTHPWYLLAKKITTLTALFISSQSALALGVGDKVDSSTLKKLDYQKDTILVVDFFAEWCESCRKELPLISKLNSQFSDNKKVLFLGVDTDDELQVAIDFQKELTTSGALNFPVVNDVNQSIVSTFKPMGFPALYIIKDQTIVAEHLGATANIDKVIQKSLESIAGE